VDGPGGRAVTPDGGRSLRWRLTVATTGVVVVALVGGAVLMVAVLQGMLLRQRDDAAREQARDVAALVTSGRLPDPVPTGGTTLVQVVDDQGRVRAASPGGDRLVPLLDAAALDAVRRGEAVDLPGRRIGIDEPLRVVGVVAGSGPDRQTVLLVGPVTDLQRGIGAVRGAVAVAVGLLVLGTGVLTRALVGSALRPVEELTRGAEAMAAPGSVARLPLPAADDEIRRLAVTLNALVDRLRVSAQRQREFVSDAAHELRSPLASIRTGLEVAVLHPKDVDWPQTASDALADAARMARLVDDLLLLARADEAAVRPTPAGRTDGHTEPDGDLALAADAVLARAAPPPGLDLQRDGDPAAPVPVPHDVLVRITANLVENALRHARTTVRVTATAATESEVARLIVTDDGPGIPAAERSRVFGRFTRLDGGRGRDSGGAGLGLAIVQELVRAAQGQVELQDAGPGLRVVVELGTTDAGRSGTVTAHSPPAPDGSPDGPTR